MPHVGILTYGEAARTAEPAAIPAAQTTNTCTYRTVANDANNLLLQWCDSGPILSQRLHFGLDAC